MKKCRRCLKLVSKDEFRKDGRYTGGYSHFCTMCEKMQKAFTGGNLK